MKTSSDGFCVTWDCSSTQIIQTPQSQATQITVNKPADAVGCKNIIGQN
jgi:hypothetical protein